MKGVKICDHFFLTKNRMLYKNLKSRKELNSVITFSDKTGKFRTKGDKISDYFFLTKNKI